MQGAADPATGLVVGGSRDVEVRLASLPADVEADARTVNELLGNSGVPEAVAGRLATTARVLFGGGVPAVLAQVPGVVVGALSGDLSRLATAVTSAAAGVAASVALGLADRAHARLTARLAVHDDARRGASPAVRGVLDAAAERLAGEIDAFRTELAAQQPDVAGRARPSRSLPAAPPTSPSAPTGAGGALHPTTTTATPDPAVPVSVPRVGAWLAKTATGPVTSLLGVGVLALLALPLSPALAWSAAASTAAAGLVAYGQRSLADSKAGLEATRKSIERARTTATARARAQAELRVEVDRRESAEQQAAAARADVSGPSSTAPVTPPSPTTPQLTPGPVDGPLAATDLGSADRARLAAVATAAQAVLDAGPATAADVRATLLAALRSTADAAGMTSDPTSTETDPDLLGWPHRRLLLDPDLQAVLQQLDTLPSGVPRLRTHLAAATWGVAVPGALTALPGVLLGVGVGPLALVALGVLPVGAAVATAVRQHAAATAVERGTTARAQAKTDLPAAARQLLDAEVADARALAEARQADAVAQQDLAGRVEDSRDARQDRLTTRRRRLLDALVGPGDPAVDLPPAPAPTALQPTVPDAPGPVTPDAPVTAPWVRSVLTAVAAPVVGTVAAVAAWHLSFAADVGPLWAASTWTGLSDLAAAGAVAVVAGVGAALSAAMSAGVEAWSENTKAAAAEQRAAALKVHEAARAQALREVELGPRREVRDGLLDAVRQAEARQVARALDGERQADAAVPRRPAGLVTRLLDWMRTQTDAVARAVLDGSAPGDPAARAALGRLAAGLSRTPGPAAPGSTVLEQLARVLHGARTAELGPGDVPGSPELDRVLELDRALAPTAPAPAPADRNAPRGVDWDHVRAIANALGWWPEDVEAVVPDPVHGHLPATDPSPAGRSSANPPAADPPAADPPAADPPAAARPAADPPAGGPTSVSPSAPPPTDPSHPAAAPADTGGAEPPAARPGPAGPPPFPYRPGPGAPSGPDGVPGRPDVLVEDWPDGTGRTLTTSVEVASPGGQTLRVLARWVEPGPGRRPVLVLSQLPGEPFWWGVAAAVQQAVARALTRLVPGVDPHRLRQLVLLAERPGPDGRPDLAEFPVRVADDGTVQLPAGPRQLPPAEVVAATAALRLTPLAELAGRWAQPVVSR